MNDLNIILTRFSLYNEKIMSVGWKLGRTKSADKVLEELMDNERLQTRSEIFFDYSLPAIDLAYKNGFNIKHIVMHYDKLPEWLLEKLDNASKTYPWFNPIAIGFHDDVSFFGEIEKCVQAQNFETGKIIPIAGIRLDDDDVIGVKFFNKLKKYLKPEFCGFCISFPKGIIGLWESGFKKYANFKEDKCAQGLSQVTLFDTSTNKFASPYLLSPGTHLTVDERVPTILDSIGEPVYLRTLHSTNDIMQGVSNDDIGRYINRMLKDEVLFTPQTDL
ncbi:hypothetical protein VEE31_45120 (plasmid) [Escherichia coli]|jgi:hypothetical protein|uniref:putative rhamnosyl transferase n=1 Tax=Escherichia coli TaxID=562 RepID=UPI00214782AD|nr:putative rhamnosyl transferase [Escherichia coli]MCR1071422.1 putative rhamnosyl transferase [Escherichia coli]MDT9421226.1 putative rhamnosyl transferase [Escherichia coli]BEA38047.1 hypothetical protein VEE31_45120 [Escherichia coli]